MFECSSFDSWKAPLMNLLHNEINGQMQSEMIGSLWEYIIVHMNLPLSKVILWLELGAGQMVSINFWIP